VIHENFRGKLKGNCLPLEKKNTGGGCPPNRKTTKKGKQTFDQGVQKTVVKTYTGQKKNGLKLTGAEDSESDRGTVREAVSLWIAHDE